MMRGGRGCLLVVGAWLAIVAGAIIWTATRAPSEPQQDYWYCGGQEVGLGPGGRVGVVGAVHHEGVRESDDHLCSAAELRAAGYSPDRTGFWLPPSSLP